MISEKSVAFAVRVVKMCRHLRSEKREMVLSQQLLRSGTSIGINVSEAKQAQSRADFIAKMSIALKETAETKYWLRLLYETDDLNETEFQSVFSDCSELEKILTSIIKTAKQ